MTKRVRIENADGGTYFGVLVQIYDKASAPGVPDTLAKEIVLPHPTAMTNEDVFITSTRYIVVKELGPATQT